MPNRKKINAFLTGGKKIDDFLVAGENGTLFILNAVGKSEKSFPNEKEKLSRSLEHLSHFSLQI